MIDSYLASITILEPIGNAAAEVSVALEDLSNPDAGRLPDAELTLQLLNTDSEGFARANGRNGGAARCLGGIKCCEQTRARENLSEYSYPPPSPPKTRRWRGTFPGVRQGA